MASSKAWWWVETREGRVEEPGVGWRGGGGRGGALDGAGAGGEGSFGAARVARLLGEGARVRLLVLHLVHEDGVVEREAEADGVGGREAGGGVGGGGVGRLRAGGVLGLGGALGELGEVTEVVGLHLLVEDCAV